MISIKQVLLKLSIPELIHFLSSVKTFGEWLKDLKAWALCLLGLM